jgi:hypothetical protein
MKLPTKTLILLIISCTAKAFCPSTGKSTLKGTELSGSVFSRENFLATCIATVTATATSSLLSIEPAEARGRATLEYSCDRYYPRLEAGGVFYANDLKRAIEKSDWAAIKASYVLS